MCRNIRPLNNFEPPATRDEVTAAALQYVRKVAGTRQDDHRPRGQQVEGLVLGGEAGREGHA